jgi:hypothetical protein
VLNPLVMLCAESEVQPAINTGTLSTSAAMSPALATVASADPKLRATAIRTQGRRRHV